MASSLALFWQLISQKQTQKTKIQNINRDRLGTDSFL
jgi:hypothetical protein